jgi:hypothetical protein
VRALSAFYLLDATGVKVSINRSVSQFYKLEVRFWRSVEIKKTHSCNLLRKTAESGLALLLNFIKLVTPSKQEQEPGLKALFLEQ